MKLQWNLVFALLFSLIVAVFSLANTTPVLVNYLFGSSEVPLVLVIIISALFGGITIGLISTFFYIKLKWKLSKTEKEILRRNEMMDNSQVVELKNDQLDSETVETEEKHS